MSAPPRLLRQLLRLFPREHRAEYGEGMWEVVRRRYACVPERGLARLRLHAEVALDLLWSAAGIWTTRATRRGRGMGSGWRLDGRFVLRSLRRRPGYAATAVVVLAAAVAVNAAVFSFVRGTLLAEPSWPGAERAVMVWGSNPADGQLRDVVSGPNYLDLRGGATSLEALAAVRGGSAALLRDGRPEVVDVFEVTPDFFDAVPVEPFLGRVFGEEDRSSSAPATVMVTHGFWRNELGGDPEAVGTAIPLDGEPHTVVGVLPEDFRFLLPAPVWIPLRDDVLAADERTRIHYNLLGRLRAGVTPAAATRDLSRIMREIAAEHRSFEGWSVLAEPVHDVAVMAVRPVLWTVTAAVALILLVALANLSTLFRIRTLARGDELAVRMALGAGAGRIGRVLGLEALLLAGTGTAVGLVAARPLLDAVRGLVPLWIPIPESAVRLPVLQAVLDPRVVGATAVLALVGVLALAAPGLVSAIRRGASGRDGRRAPGAPGTRLVVTAQLALATVLCLGAGLTGRSAARLLDVDLGVRDEGLLTLWFGDVWERSPEEITAYYRDVIRKIESLPGVTSAAVIGYVPFLAEDDFAGIGFLDGDRNAVRDLREEWRRVSEGLFETAGMRIVAGRSLGPDDFRGTPRSAVVNEAFARKHYPGGRAVGAYLSVHEEAYGELEIVGVVADVRSLGPAAPAPPMLYVPFQGDPRGTTGMYVRVASGPPMAAADRVREAIWSVDPSQPVTGVAPMSELVGQWVAIPRAIRTLVGGLAGVALALAGVGVFGVVAYAMRRRRAEFGVRLALGASPGRIRREVLAGALPLVALGIGTGLLLGGLAARAARAVLHGVTPGDPLSVGLAVAAMAAAGLLAAWIPARRASRIDPSRAMRVE